MGDALEVFRMAKLIVLAQCVAAVFGQGGVADLCGYGDQCQSGIALIQLGAIVTRESGRHANGTEHAQHAEENTLHKQGDKPAKHPRGNGSSPSTVSMEVTSQGDTPEVFYVHNSFGRA